jgi:hypothetical protein
MAALGRPQQRHRLGTFAQAPPKSCQHLRRQLAQLGPAVPQGFAGQGL